MANLREILMGIGNIQVMVVKTTVQTNSQTETHSDIISVKDVIVSPITYVLVSITFNIIQANAYPSYYNFTGNLVFIIVISDIHVVLEAVLNYFLIYKSNLKIIDNQPKECNCSLVAAGSSRVVRCCSREYDDYPTDDKYSDLAKIAILLLFIGGILALSWSYAFDPHSDDSTSNHNKFTYSTSSFDYFSIMLYTTLTVQTNLKLTGRVSHYIYKFKGYDGIITGYKQNSDTGEYYFEDIHDIEKKYLTVNFNRFRDYLVAKSYLNTSFAVVLLIAAFAYIAENIIDTTYMYQLTVSSFLISYSASTLLKKHDDIIKNLHINFPNKVSISDVDYDVNIPENQNFEISIPYAVPTAASDVTSKNSNTNPMQHISQISGSSTAVELNSPSSIMSSTSHTHTKLLSGVDITK
mmetsp:Transcript_24939/g.22661  ORF Transcript_24939/g.22661 Transcript_24939/m.22661 type:complete len:409 (-) Transcript_24939:374-1600(-)